MFLRADNLTMLSRHADPIAAIATAPGRGAVGIVRVSSPQDLAPLIDALCGRPLKPREASYLPFRDVAGAAIDLRNRRAGPRAIA